MAEKDILEKILMSYADVFADLENVFTYGGKQKLRAENLQPAPTESFYKGKSRMHQQFCDESFYLVKDGAIKIQYIIENETRMKRRQILRKISYHGGAYRQQLELNKPVYPVLSIVINWTQKRTYIPLSLHELLVQDGTIQDEISRIENVKLEVHHMRNLPKEVRDQFTSDIGFVAEYLNTGSFESRRNQNIIHVEALCQMMEALTGDTRFTDLIENLMQKQEEKGDEIIMCEYIDMLEARGEIRGEKRLADLIQRLLKEKKYDDISLASSDSRKRQELYHMYGI